VNLVFLGAPGSGKGTQAARLADRLSLAHLSTGDLLRAAVKDGTNLGRKAEKFMKAGELVPDEVIIALIEEKRNTGELNGGCIFDGFPRTVPQAQALDDLFGRADAKIDRAVLLEIADDEIIGRLSGRFYCAQCQMGYNDRINMPEKPGICDRCGGRVVRRPDDEPDVVKNRLDVYRKQTRPIEDYYRRRSVLLEIRGIGTPDEIFDRIWKGLGLA
jgi:adenylate kinase